jgi:dihydroorotate dehydrogenase
MGFNNRGMAAAARALTARRRRGVAGINIGANKNSADRIADYRAGFETLAPLADYVAVNVSSPNTPGLRALQDAKALRHLLETLLEARTKSGSRVPLLLKIAPDLEMPALDDITQIALSLTLDGLIVSNTTLARPASLRGRHARQSGGLSGAPLFAPSTALLKEARRRVGGRLVLIGVGGVSSGAEAYAKIRAGATLVQLYTALALEGPRLIARIKRELLACLTSDGFSSISESVGKDVD